MTPEMKLATALSSQPKEEPAMEKEASISEEEVVSAKEKIAMAESWGRELAKREFVKKEKTKGNVKSKEKVALAPTGMIGRAIETGRKALGAIAPGAAGKAIGSAAGRAGLYGAGAGAALGGARGLIKNPGVDPQTGQQRSRLGAVAKGVVGGGLVGGALGAGGSALASGVSRMSPTAANMMGRAGNAVQGAASKVRQVAGQVGGEIRSALPAKTVAASVDFSKLAEDFRARTRR